MIISVGLAACLRGGSGYGSVHGELVDHLDAIVLDVAPSSDGCEDCLAAGTQWVHLRRCATCGHIGCCDSSPMRHATAHVASSSHPIVKSNEPGEDWLWCYVDSLAFEIDGLADSPSHP